MYKRNRGINTETPTDNVSSQMSALLKCAPGELPDYDSTYLLESSIEPQSQAYAQHIATLRANPSAVKDNKQFVQLQGSDDIITSVEKQQQIQQQLQGCQSIVRGVNTPYPEDRGLMPLQQTDPNLDDYMRLPTDEVPNEDIGLRTIMDFSKIYDTGKQYTGKPYDLLDDRMGLFFSVCKSAGISKGQFHAVFPRILAEEAETYYINYLGNEPNFASIYRKMKNRFSTDVNMTQYHTDWSTTSYMGLKSAAENVDKSAMEALEVMLKKLRLCQHALGLPYLGEELLRMQVRAACSGVQEFEYALQKPSTNCEMFFSELQPSLALHLAHTTTIRGDINMQGYPYYEQADDNTFNAYYTDRQYGGSYRGRGRGRGRGVYRDFNNRGPRSGLSGGLRSEYRKGNDKKLCIVCGKENCWSKNHSSEERRASRASCVSEHPDTTPEDYAVYVAKCEGNELDSWYEDKDEQIKDEQMQRANGYLTGAAFIYRLTGEDIYRGTTKVQQADQFIIEDRYTADVFQGIMPDSGASKMPTAGKRQYLALRRDDPSVETNTSTAGQAEIHFGPGKMLTSLGTIAVKTAIGPITFHVMDVPTRFLLCLKDMDDLGVYFDNTANDLVKRLPNGEKRVPVIRKWGHVWFHLQDVENAIANLTDAEMRQLHRRFNHPAAERLFKLLNKAGHHDVDLGALMAISEFCHHCQTHGPAPKRFKFTLKDDHEFNYEILVDVFYLQGQPVLHVVDSATNFHGARYLPSMDTKDTWEALRMLWINTYLGPRDVITHDAGTNFNSVEFRNDAKMMGIQCKQVPVEAHWAIGKVERSHAMLRRAFDIIKAEIGSSIGKGAVLQMAVKSLNDTVGLDGLVPTLLFFGAYPRMTHKSPPSSTTLARGADFERAMRVLRKASAKWQVQDALNTRNGPFTNDVLSIPLLGEALVYRENEKWDGPYKVLSIDNPNLIIDNVNGPQTFRVIHVEPYKRDDTVAEPEQPRLSQHNPPPPVVPILEERPHRECPCGSKNKPKDKDEDYRP